VQTVATGSLDKKDNTGVNIVNG